MENVFKNSKEETKLFKDENELDKLDDMEELNIEGEEIVEDYSYEEDIETEEDTEYDYELGDDNTIKSLFEE